MTKPIAVRGVGLRSSTSVVAVLLSLLPLALLGTRVLSYLEYLTVGPRTIAWAGATRGRFLDNVWSTLGIGREIDFNTSQPLAVAAIVMCLATGRHLLRQGVSRRFADLLPQAAVMLGALALAYRFPALMVATGVLVHQLASKKARPFFAWLGVAICVLLCVLPLDVSLRDFEGPARWASAKACMGSSDELEYLANKRVCVSWESSDYLEPRLMWVW